MSFEAFIVQRLYLKNCMKSAQPHLLVNSMRVLSIAEEVMSFSAPLLYIRIRFSMRAWSQLITKLTVHSRIFL